MTTLFLSILNGITINIFNLVLSSQVFRNLKTPLDVQRMNKGCTRVYFGLLKIGVVKKTHNKETAFIPKLQ